MAHGLGAQRSGGSQTAPADGLMLIRLAVGVYLFFVGVGKASWLLDSTPLANQLSFWLSHASPLSRWYLERIMPGTPVFARLVPLGEIVGGLALLLGFWTRLVAGVSLLMILNFQFAAGALFSYAYLTNATGIPLLGALLGLTIGGGRLPLTLRR
jgi:uncharacterized membrane protein YphA (DoxX/SURF4 family)